MTNISFLYLVYYYTKGNSIFITKPYDEKPMLFWGENIGWTEMERKDFTSLVLSGVIVRIGEL
jgi:hypothetical protein